MKKLSTKIHEVIIETKPLLLNITPEVAAQKPSSNTWSKKEILGHLIDSATNNHQRFIKGAHNISEVFPVYDQNRWVKVQRYNKMNWHNLIDLFVQYNLYLCRVIDYIPPNAFNNLCRIGTKKPVTLKFIIEDYLRHLNHHINQILSPSE